MKETMDKIPRQGKGGVYTLAHKEGGTLCKTNSNHNDTNSISLSTKHTHKSASGTTLDQMKPLQGHKGEMGDMREQMQERWLGSSGRWFGKQMSSCRYDMAQTPVSELDANQEGVLKVSNRSFCENGCEELLRIIKKNNKLMELDLSGCNIYKGDDLAQIIHSATSLKRLSLEWNSLGLARTGISSLASAISSNRSLKEVDLRSNRIGPTTATALAHALQSNYSLTCLDLRWNEIGPKGAAAFVAMLQQNHCLTEIRLVGNGIPPTTQAQIEELLEKNRRGKLFQLVPDPPLLQHHPFLKYDIIGLNSKFKSKEMNEINLERITSLQKEIDNLRCEVEACKKELYEVQQEKVASDSQLENTRVEMKEENLLRKFIEKETGELKSQLYSSRQKVQDLEDKLKKSDQMVAMKLATINSEVMEAKAKGLEAQVSEAETKRENKHLKDQMERIQVENKTRKDATQDRAKNDADYKSAIIKRLEAQISEQNQKKNEELDSMRNKFSSQVKNLEIARDEATHESERQKCIARQCETQLAIKEQCSLSEKDTTQKVFDGKMNTMKAELVTLKNQIEESKLEQQKVKKKHASSVDEYEGRISHLTSSISKLEVVKSKFDDEMLLMTNDQSKLEDKVKAGVSKLKEMELIMESERVKHAQVLAHESAKHLEDRKSLENEVLAARRQIEVVHLHIKEIQSEQERRTFDTERRVTSAETAITEWIHQQFAALKSALIVQHSFACVG